MDAGSCESVVKGTLTRINQRILSEALPPIASARSRTLYASDERRRIALAGQLPPLSSDYHFHVAMVQKGEGHCGAAR